MDKEKDIRAIADVILKALQERLNEEEESLLSSWLKQSARNRKLFQKLQDENYVRGEYAKFLRMDTDKAWQMVVRRKRRMAFLTIARYAAACIAGVGILSLPFLLKPEAEQPATVVAEQVITPGSAKAVLMIGGEQKIVLDNEHTLNLRDSSGMVIRTDSALLRYQQEGTTAKEPEVQYHTLFTERGGEYRIALADGTKVIINSESKLRYPSRFVKGERRVYLDGEAYFEVAKDEKRPFLVETGGVTVQVYGTEFNVNTRGERVRTVLVEGSVGVRGKRSTKEYRMRPSELAEFSSGGEFIDLRKVDVEKYVSWKDGVLIFDDETLENIMESLTLWYDVDVFYQNPELKHLRFGGYLRKYENIDIILEAIHRIVGVHFSVNGKTVIVQK